jgi:hypothetical protein
MRLKTLFIVLALTLALALGSSCAFYRNGRTWVSDVKFEQARKLYDETGSLALTEQKLRETDLWRRSEINEALYRLRKQNHLE